MMKPILLVSVMMFSAPVLAQQAPQQTGATPEAQATGQDEAATSTDSLDAHAGATATAQDSTSTPADPSTTPAQPAQSANAATGAAQPQQASATQIAQIVETEFPNYDADKDGEITKDEFGKWMVALRSATDPATNAQSAEVQTWVGNAFASADADKSTKVSKVELTTFLSQGAS